MLDAREAATVCAAILYWQEEMSPHGEPVMRPYFEDLGLERFEPLTAAELRELIDRLKANIG